MLIFINWQNGKSLESILWQNYDTTSKRKKNPTFRFRDNLGAVEQKVGEAGTPHPRKKIKTYLGIMGFLWALEWRKK